MESSDSQAYIGYSKQRNNVWTVEFNLTEPPENENIHFNVAKFKILQIENSDGKLLRKVQNYTINSEYYLRKHPIRVFLKRENLDFHKFYETCREKYDNYSGQITEYYFDGNVFCTYYLVSGKLNGHFIAKERNGDIIEEAFFVDNLRHGITQIINNNYEIQCEYNMGILIDTNIILSKYIIYDIYKSYIWNNNNKLAVVNDTININHKNYDYDYDTLTNKTIIGHIAFTGTIVLENSKIISSDITITDIKKQEIINEYVKPLPEAICDSRRISYTYYYYNI